MEPKRRVSRFVSASVIALLGACRADGPVGVVPQDTDVPAVDTGVDAGPVDTGVDVAPMDAGMDVAADDVAADVARDAGADARTDVAADRPRDAGRVCVCPPLPMMCTPPRLDTPSFTPDGALLTELMGLVSCATTSLHVAMYQTLWNCLPQAILARLDAAPQLNVQIVYDDESCPLVGGHLSCPLSVFEGNARVTLVSDARTTLMHDKFIVADGTRVWVGSANSSEESYCQLVNDAIVTEEAPIVAAYEREFQRMFRDRMFGPMPVDMPTTSGRYTVYFSPRTPVTTAARTFSDMVAAIGSATTSVDFVIASWTRTEVSDALIAARARGVTVRGVVAPTYIRDVPATALRMAGVALRVGNVHSKLMVIDGQTVVTGSANWSAASWANNENSLWIRDMTLGAAYTAWFERVHTAATLFTGM